MASSNRHWPSMFKSKPCNTHHQWQHDINPALMPSACQRSPYTSVPGGEERSPEPKPRWNPKPEQIRILESIFNSGMVNPPRDEIRKIRAQLQEYGQVGDANVFYWFQNRKSRSKHKQRHLHQTGKYQNQIQTTSIPITTTATIAASSSSSSSSEKSSPTKTDKSFAIAGTNVIGVSNSPTASVNQTYFQTHGSFLPEPFYFPVQQTGGGGDAVFSQEYYFSELSNVVQISDEAIGTCSGLLLSELMMTQNASRKEQEEKMKMDQQLCYTNINTTTAPTTNTISTTTTINAIQGVGECSSAAHVAKSTVFINDVAFEVGMGPFNVREAFGNDVVLIHSSGQPVLTNEWGVTLQYLQHGAFYYLV